MDFKKNYYEILEVNNSASKEEIRAAYRRLAKLHHPDRNPGNLSAEEKFKLINEAHEILSNDILRYEYDAYVKQEEQWKANQQSQKNEDAFSSHQRTYFRKKTVTTETRIYVHGKIRVKYWADQDESSGEQKVGEVSYKITPTEATVQITETEIFPIKAVPLEYLKAFKESDLFKSQIPQPVKCTITTMTGEEYFELELKDIRIKNILFEGVTKHEGRSFGTLIGDLYAYSPKIETHEEKEAVTECFGETGNIETKAEGDTTSYRKEYHNPDCTTYWGEWIKLRKRAQATNKPAGVVSEVTGCAQWWWLPFIIFLLFLFPKFFIGILILVGIGLLFSLGSAVASELRGIVSIVGITLFVLLLVSAVRSFSGSRISYIQHDIPTYDSVSTSRQTIKKENTSSDTIQSVQDTLISHFIRWRDYNNINYQTTLSVWVSDVRASVIHHNTMNPLFSTNSLAPAYSEMIRNDTSRLKLIYSAFDSIKVVNSLNDLTFARMLVSCVQSIPYALVVDRSCNERYDDEFTNNYLASCAGDCCIGFEKYGVRSGVEFLSDLKGDCDTRAVFLYGLLKHYNYNVALITSQYYQHAMIAVNFPSEVNGLSMNIHNRNYYLWETTTAGLDAGQIQPGFSNLDYWEIALLNENH